MSPKNLKSLTSFALSFPLSFIYLFIYYMAHFLNPHTLSCLFALWPHPFFLPTKLLLVDKDTMLDVLNLSTFLASYEIFQFSLYEFIITIYFFNCWNFTRIKLNIHFLKNKGDFGGFQSLKVREKKKNYQIFILSISCIASHTYIIFTKKLYFIFGLWLDLAKSKGWWWPFFLHLPLDDQKF
jgi:hypothetical protein